MLEQMENPKRQTQFTFVVLIPMLLIFSFLLSSWFQARDYDFGLYWQAGHMILDGQNVYDTEQWITVRAQERTALHSEPTFQYPLPLAVFFALIALLPIQTAYTIWLFLGQLAILTSIVILLQFFPERTGYLELLAIAGIFFFRPMFSVFNSGQILPFLILCISLSIWMFAKGHWFRGGGFLAVLSLKPSIGFPILVLAGLWLLFGKRWRGLAGMFAGGIVLLAIGLLVNYRWIIDYISIGGNSFTKYYGMHPTLWGAVAKIVGRNGPGLWITILCILLVLAVQAYLFRRNSTNLSPFEAFSSLIPAALLTAPYSWNYDQVMLMIPILFLLIKVASRYGTGKAVLFMTAVVTLTMLLVAVAYAVQHDVWSILNTMVLWLFTIYFISGRRVLQWQPAA